MNKLLSITILLSLILLTASVLAEEDCKHVGPYIKISPYSQLRTPGSTAEFDVIVTNKDGPSCDASIFNFGYTTPVTKFLGEGTYSSNELPPTQDVKWSVSLSPPFLTIDSGETKTSKLSVAIPSEFWTKPVVKSVYLGGFEREKGTIKEKISVVVVGNNLQNEGKASIALASKQCENKFLTKPKCVDETGKEVSTIIKKNVKREAVYRDFDCSEKTIEYDVCSDGCIKNKCIERVDCKYYDEKIISGRCIFDDKKKKNVIQQLEVEKLKDEEGNDVCIGNWKTVFTCKTSESCETCSYRQSLRKCTEGFSNIDFMCSGKNLKQLYIKESCSATWKIVEKCETDCIDKKCV